MIRRPYRLISGLLLAFLLMLSPTTMFAQADSLELTQTMPSGVTFEVLAEESGPVEIDADVLFRVERLTVGCEEATDEISGTQQMVYVDYGRVDVRDWRSGDVVATLGAGESLGPADMDEAFYLTGAQGHRASVYRVSYGEAAVGAGGYPDSTYETTDCSSGVDREMEREPATVEIVFEGALEAFANEGQEMVFHAGVMTVEPGEALGRVHDTESPAYVSNGVGVVMPVVGGFGEGTVGMGGLFDPELAPGETLSFGAQTQVALENFGSTSTVALVFGMVREDSPIFQAMHR